MARRFASLACSTLSAALLLSGLAGAAKGKAKKANVKFHPEWASHPSARYGALTASQCMAELSRRGIETTSEKRAPGVLAPVRLPKGVGGVMFRTEVASHLRSRNPYDVFDCRLVLSLSDWSQTLQARAIDLVLMFSAWRPPPKKWPEGKLETRHPGALAIDAYRFGKQTVPGETSRRWLDVEKDFRGTIGAPACGPDASLQSGSSPETRELRAITCEAVEKHLFTTILTPNYNRAHHNHLHMEVTPFVKWHLLR
jgi:hypothetical protein